MDARGHEQFDVSNVTIRNVRCRHYNTSEPRKLGFLHLSVLHVVKTQVQGFEITPTASWH